MRCFKLKNDMDSTLIVRILCSCVSFIIAFATDLTRILPSPPRDWYKLE